MLSKQTIQLPSALWIIGKDVALLGHPLRRPLRSFFTTPLVPLELRMVHCHLKRLHLGEVDAKRLEVILQLLQNQRPLVFIQADMRSISALAPGATGRWHLSMSMTSRNILTSVTASFSRFSVCTSCSSKSHP